MNLLNPSQFQNILTQSQAITLQLTHFFQALIHIDLSFMGGGISLFAGMTNEEYEAYWTELQDSQTKTRDEASNRESEEARIGEEASDKNNPTINPTQRDTQYLDEGEEWESEYGKADNPSSTVKPRNRGKSETPPPMSREEIDRIAKETADAMSGKSNREKAEIRRYINSVAELLEKSKKDPRDKRLKERAEKAQTSLKSDYGIEFIDPNENKSAAEKELDRLKLTYKPSKKEQKRIDELTDIVNEQTSASRQEGRGLENQFDAPSAERITNQEMFKWLQENDGGGYGACTEEDIEKAYNEKNTLGNDQTTEPEIEDKPWWKNFI